MKYFFSFLLLIGTALTQAQGVKISQTPGIPDSSAGLELDFNDRGFLPPRLTQTQRNAIPNPAEGLTIYNLTSKCLEMFSQNNWRQIACGCNALPNPAFSFSPLSPGFGASVQFNPSDPSLAQYQWSFASGTPSNSNQTNPSVLWAQAGTYNIQLKVTDNQGCTDSSIQQIVVQNCPQGSQTFVYTGQVQTFVVPNCVTQITIEAWGAQGGNASPAAGIGGLGGYATGTLTVQGGETLYVYVGQAGISGGSATFGGGGSGGASSRGSGGGASDVRQGGQNLNQRVIVAGGGGGAGSGNNGGAGGGSSGLAGNSPNGDNGGGGTQSIGGNDGGCSGACGNGSFGVGANGAGGNCNAAGGGGGWYGGGTCTTGGGGSGTTAGVSNASMQTGIRNGNGQVIISY